MRYVRTAYSVRDGAPDRGADGCIGISVVIVIGIGMGAALRLTVHCPALPTTAQRSAGHAFVQIAVRIPSVLYLYFVFYILYILYLYLYLYWCGRKRKWSHKVLRGSTKQGAIWGMNAMECAYDMAGT
jgi:uncharacterized BrkB/YihY/UPF0761 family membrane protein